MLVLRSGVIKIESSSFTSSSGSSSIVAGGSLALEMSKTPGNDGPLLSAGRSTNGFSSLSDGEPSFGM